MATDSIAAAIRVFQPAAKTIPVVGTILDGVFGSVLELYKVLERLKTNRKQATDLIDRIGFLSLTIGRKCESQSESISVDVEELQVLLSEITACVKRIEGGGSHTPLIRFLKRVGSADKDNENLQGLYKKVTEAIERFQIATSIEAINKDSRQSEDAMLSNLEEILKPVHEALSGSDTAPPSCLEGTRAALLQELVQWISSDSPERILWLCGMAGTGKSAVAKSVCDLVDDRLRDNGGHSMTFFISHDAAARKDPLHILHTLLFFMARANREFRRRLHSTLRGQPELVAASLSTQGTLLLLEPLSRCSDSMNSLIIIIDALDECSEGSELLRCFVPLFSQDDYQVRLIFTGRYESSIDSVFSTVPERRFLRLDAIDPSTVQLDIEMYFSFHLRSLTRDQIHALALRANGLFIYAATLVRFVECNDFYGEEELLHVLLREGSAIDAASQLPLPDYGPLDDVYLRILRGVLPPTKNSQNRQVNAALVRSIVGTLVSAYDSISPHLLARLVGRSFDQVEKVLRRLYAVLTIDDDGAIRLLHLSFSEFLLDPARCTDSLFHPDALSLVGIHSTALLGSLEILNASLCSDICQIGTPSHTGSVLSDLALRLQLYVPSDLAYAAKNWSAHMERIPPSPAAHATVATALLNFCQAPITAWVELAIMLGYPDLVLQALDFVARWWGHGPESDLPLCDDPSTDPSRPMDNGKILRMLNSTLALVHTVKRRMELFGCSQGNSPAMAISALSSPAALDESRLFFALRVVHYIGCLSPFETYHAELEGATDGYECASFTVISGDGRLVAAARGASIVIRDGGSGSPVATFTLPDNSSVTDLCFSCNGMYLAATGLRPSSTITSTTLAVFTARESQWGFFHLWEDGIPTDYRLGAVSSDGQLIALSRLDLDRYRDPSSGLDDPNRPGYILVKNIMSHKTRHLFTDVDRSIHGISSCLAFSPDSRVLVAAHPQGEVTVWNLGIATLADRIQGYNIVPRALRRYLANLKQQQELWLEFSWDGKHLSCGNEYDQVLTFAVDCNGSSSEPRFECLTPLGAGRVGDVGNPSMRRVRWVYVLRG
ncbi:hypothetical protein EXIGLDRAFT_318498 [Exidia glandulosa HHB12029]|uniref:Nephrocystin 3-like N-terminal domain-containing protein n=1 Tax=Exidia glandulosa HHB12029 TaxID=1314781 RepID=A0A166BPM3_EXIGL|nr:hypothetical protein EXIGLDRAFT_318498 [Exidia glandulosa HHB12029]